jgi:outer membrane murein-binding lipoprotein Lpp
MPKTKHFLLVFVLATLALAGCGSSSEVASDRAKQGAPCEAHELEPSNATFASQCEAQKNREAAGKEDKATEEALREAKRLKQSE